MRFGLSKSLLYALTGFSLPVASYAATYQAEVLADSPVRYYRLGETGGSTANNLGTQGATGNGTYNNFAASAFGKPGIPGGGGDTAVEFDGSNDWISSVGTGVAGDSTVTLEAWVKITDLTTNGYAVSYLRDNQNNRYHAIGVNSSEQPILSQDQNGGGGTVNGSTSLTAGEWYHLVAVFSASPTVDKLYVNGTLVASFNGPNPDGVTDRFYVGLLHNRSGGTGWFKGIIDEVAFYSYELPETRILAHYNTGIPEPSSLAELGALAALLLSHRKR